MLSGAQLNTDSIGTASLRNEDSSLVMISKLNVNSEYSDFSPVLFNQQLHFVSGRPAQIGIQYSDTENNTEITDIYSAALRSPDRMKNPRPLAGINSKYHEGPFTFNITGDRIYFTGNDRASEKLKIFVSYLSNAQWSAPEMLPFCRDSFSYCHPSLAPGDSLLYFSSNRGNEGNMDIFFSTFKDGEWTAPVNAGDRINTSHNEVFPFAGRSGFLYFSSNRPGGVGGLDLYNVKTTDNAAGPLLLYPPLNSAGDDLGIWTDSSGLAGYFSSNRNKKTGDDIYYFSRSIPDFSRSDSPAVRRRFCYTFYEETSLSNSDTINLDFEWRFGDGATARGLTTRHCYTSPGTYNVQLLVVEKVSGEVSSSLVNYEVHIPDPPRLKIVCKDTAEVNEFVLMDASGSALKDHEIREIYWSFGDGFYNKGEIVKHRYRIPGKYVVELWVVASHRETGTSHKFRVTREINVSLLN